MYSASEFSDQIFMSNITRIDNNFIEIKKKIIGWYSTWHTHTYYNMGTILNTYAPWGERVSPANIKKWRSIQPYEFETLKRYARITGKREE